MQERLGHLRATDPKKFALFTGRDQMQALTGLFAKQFGTPNYAAHGGFCSVNMAAGMIYTIGGSFWEFGGPDLERAKLFVMIGTAEDHHSNPMKMALSKFKRQGGKFISINPVRTGYSAIADEWVPIKPGTDGALFLALTNEIIRQGLYDRDFLAQYSNAAELVNMDENSSNTACSCASKCRMRRAASTRRTSCGGTATWTSRSPPIRRAPIPTFWANSNSMTARRSNRRSSCWWTGSRNTPPSGLPSITGIPAETIKRLAHEMGITARDEKDRVADSLDRYLG